MHTFSEPWDSWEMHPYGEELCVDGELTLHQEIEGEVRRTTIGIGKAVINPAGI